MSLTDPRQAPEPPRPLNHGKGSVLNARVTGEMRAALEAEAERSGRSLSGVVELWLELARRGEGVRPPAEPVILFVKPGAVQPDDKARLTQAGIIVVEVDDPQAVNLARPSRPSPVEELSHGDLLAALARAIRRSGGYVAQYTGEEVAKAILARHGRANANDDPT